MYNSMDFVTGPFNIRINSDCRQLTECISYLYHNTLIPSTKPSASIYHYQIDIIRPENLRRFIRPQIELLIDGLRPFEPYPLHHHLPLFEWGLNWIIAMTGHQYLLLHSAALEFEGAGCLFPAMPGSGKSTLCAALAYHGWRLLSDEFGIVDHCSGKILPMPRTIGLKNESIPIIRDYLPDAIMGPSFYKTRKGTVAHLAPTKSSLENQHVSAAPRLIIFPSYSSSPGCRLKPIEKSLAFTKLSNNAFNYRVSMRAGFQSLSQIIGQCDSYTFDYHSLDQAVETLTELINEKYLR